MLGSAMAVEVVDQWFLEPVAGIGPSSSKGYMYYRLLIITFQKLFFPSKKSGSVQGFAAWVFKITNIAFELSDESPSSKQRGSSRP
jgi:hypothetical protein